MKSNPEYYKQYFINALELRNVYITPEDKEFYLLIERYEKLKQRYNKTKKWIKEAATLNVDFENYIKKLYSEPPFEMSRPPCGIEVRSITIDEDLNPGGVVGLINIEFVHVPFEEAEEHIFVDLDSEFKQQI